MSREPFGAKVMRAKLAKEGRGPRVFEVFIIKAGTLKSGQMMLAFWWWLRAVHKYGTAATGRHVAEFASCEVRQGDRYLTRLRRTLGDDLLTAMTHEALEVIGPRLDSLEALKADKRREAEGKVRDQALADLGGVVVRGFSL